MNDGLEKNHLNNGLEKVRTYTRTGAFAILLANLCALSWLTKGELQSMIVGAIIGSFATVTIFYFKKSED